MVMLKALEAAITQVETIRDHEFTFEVDGRQITLRPLRSFEETEVQRYSQVAWEGMSEEGDTAAYQEFMDRVRLSTLGFSVIRIGELDLRDVEYLETEEQDENGNLISVPKWEAVRDLIRAQWTKALALQVFAKFGELLERVEIRASKLVKFDPADLDEEIDRLEKRASDLKLKREERKQPPTASAVHKTQQAVAGLDRRQKETRDQVRSNVGPTAAAERARATTAPDVAQATQEVLATDEPQAPPVAQSQPQPPPRPQEPHQAPQGRQPAIPQDAAPPERRPPPEQPTEQPQEPEQMIDEQGIHLPHGGDSFFDPADPEAALAAEAQRQATLHNRNLHRLRERKVADQRADALGMPTSADLARERMQAQRDTNKPRATRLDPRTAGLREAANLSDKVLDTGAGRQQTGRPQRAQPQPAPSGSGAPATLHGKPVYKMPTQTLDRSERTTKREHGEPAPSPVQVNPAAGGRQDKFRGPGE